MGRCAAKHPHTSQIYLVQICANELHLLVVDVDKSCATAQLPLAWMHTNSNLHRFHAFSCGVTYLCGSPVNHYSHSECLSSQ